MADKVTYLVTENKTLKEVERETKLGLELTTNA
jgi:hypothetical protein